MTPDAAFPRSTASVEAPVRWLSWVIDLGVVVVVTLLVSLGSDLLGLLVGVVGGPGYYIVTETRGGTLGHRATHLRVIDTESGAPASLVSLGLRLVVIAGLLLPLMIPFLVNAAMMAARPGWVSVHDLCSRSEARR